MKTFTVIDLNDPETTFIDCVGCTIERVKQGQAVVYTASGHKITVGPEMLYPLAILLQRKLAEAAIAGGTVTIPDLSEMNDDQLREAIEKITVE